MQDISHLKLKEYMHWLLMLHSNQEYLGRLVIWCKREGVIDLAEITKEEQEEFFVILKEAKELLTNSFKPDLFNYAFLGNKTKHLHCHIVPRYSSSREFVGMTFEDKLWGQSYKTDHSFVTAPEVIEGLKKKLII